MSKNTKAENNNVINIEEKLKFLEQENLSLKNQIKILSEKEKLYNSTLEKIKKMQAENEKSYFSSLKESKIREEEIKNNFIEFQKMIENQYKENEKRLNEELSQLTQELSKRNNIINSLQNNLNNLNDKISKDELNYHFKEKEFENVIRIKERKLEELNVAVKQITKEATEEIKRLSEQLEDFQIKSKNNVNTLMNKKMNSNMGMKDENKATRENFG